MATKSKPSAKKTAKKSAKKGAKRLTNKREKFVVEQIKAKAEGRSATSAAIAAGYAESGARQEAHRLLTNADIQARIERARSRSGVTPEEIIGTLAQYLHADVADLLDDQGRFDFDLARKRGVTGQIKKLRGRERKILGSEGENAGMVEATYELELYSALDAAKTLADIYGLKQQPKANEHDAQANREMAEKTLQQLINDCQFDRDGAIAFLRENAPDVAKWLM